MRDGAPNRHLARSVARSTLYRELQHAPLDGVRDVMSL
jgi:hypothetical protein